MAYLKLFGPEGERTIFLGASRIVLGRGEDTDVLIKDVKVSRHHCAIEPAGGRWVLKDLGSGNGTRLNGERVEEAALRPEDVIQIGDARILFAAEAAAVVPETKPRPAAGRSPVPWIVLSVVVLAGIGVAAMRGGAGGRSRPARGSEVAKAAPSDAERPPPEPPRPPESPPPKPPPADAKEAFFRQLETQFRQRVDAREYARAREIWFFLRGDPDWAEIPPPYVKRIVDSMESLETAARAERGRILEDVTLAETAHDFARAKDLLAAAVPRFQGTSVHRSLEERLEFVEKAIRVGVKGRPTQAPTVVTVDVREKVRGFLGLLVERRFGAAAEGLDALQREAKEEGAREEIAARFRECAAAEALFRAAVAELAAGRPPSQPVAKVWRVLSGGADSVHVRGKGGERDFTWREMPPDLFLALLEWPSAKAPEGPLGLAVAAHALGMQTEMIAALGRGYEQSPLRPALDAFVAARLRNEAPPQGGYVVDAGELLTRQQWVERKEQAAIAAFRTQLDRCAEKVRTNPVFARLAKMDERMAKLDAARTHALDLIFDEKTYFYPYRGVGRDAEYAKVQQEVDRRVEGVREVWEDRFAISVKPGAELDKELKLFDEAAAELEKRLVDVSERKAEIDWLRGYLGHSFTIRTYWRTPEERERILYSHEVMGDNSGVKGDITEVEREQVRVTNEYRLMFGRWAVRIVEKLVKSSRGHCEEMSRLGYFGHFSSTPGRETPFDRMKLEGYVYGASENCIMGQTNPTGAHVGWCHSSGHHRNILMAPWTEMGTGHFGIYMTQNYGQAPRYGKSLAVGAEAPEPIPVESGEGCGEPAEKFDYEGCGEN